MTLLSRLRGLLNPVQVIDLLTVGPEAPLKFAARELSAFPLRVVVCGGDGTAGWVLSAIDAVHFVSAPAVGIVPLGTGNDLARVLGWGGGYVEAAAAGEPTSMLLGQRTLTGLLLAAETAHVALLDRWDVAVAKAGEQQQQQQQPQQLQGGHGGGATGAAAAAAAAAGGGGGGAANDDEDDEHNNGGETKGGGGVKAVGESSTEPGAATGEDGATKKKRATKAEIGGDDEKKKAEKKEKKPADGSKGFVMNNYYGIGVDARVALQFHELRESKPHLFINRCCNKIIYAKIGAESSLTQAIPAPVRALARSPAAAECDLRRHVTIECDGVVLDAEISAKRSMNE